MKNISKKILCLFLILFTLITSSTSFANSPVKFADAGWDSIKFHNALCGLILENVFDYTYTEVPGGSSILHEGIKKGEIQINMETWTDNINGYYQDLDAGKLVELGSNFDDNRQGIYVPRYVIEGDRERGIKALAPNLKTVEDLSQYSHIFKDEDDPSKGRLLGATPGWDVDKILLKKYEHYDLDKNYVYFRSGSQSAHDATITSAYEKGEPILTYYWEPTWLMGKYDFVLLEDKPYEETKYQNGETSFPSVNVTISVSNDFYNDENNKDVIEFLKLYKTSSKLTSLALSHMQDTGEDYEQTALWFISENPDLIKSWLGTKNYEKLISSLNSKNKGSNNFFREFPFKLNINYDNIDETVRDFSIRHDKFFGAIRNGLKNLVSLIENILTFIPWLVFIILVFLVGYKSSKKISTGLLYGCLLLLIGSLGLWNLMIETLSIVIASVVISLLLGFPLGILISSNELANKITRPILDCLQTMPVFVYLIPALLFFGLGKAPAVIATTIYAIVPIIRLTNHGIREIDYEIVEASESFGASFIQTLINVKIPQALPTIMEGVNQTIMMAMSMVVTTSMIGATGLGMEVLVSVNRIEIGRGIISGGAVVILAILLDRMTQGIIRKTGDDNNG